MKVLVIDPVKCDGCRSCEIACSMVKEGEAGLYKSRIRTVRFPEEYFFFPSVCLQCEVPYCALVCPTAALSKNLETGVVELIAEKCVGCRMCQVACPFGAIRMVNSLPIKCDLCRGDPACVKVCEPKALTYADADESGTTQRVALGEKMKEARVALE
ncbi:4Fe-4S dicluster domain-containing protein [Chloroflexota bacterium]